MQPEEMLLPTIATLALGTALLVPLRDSRPGRRATVSTPIGPLLPKFVARQQSTHTDEILALEPDRSQGATSARNDVWSAIRTMSSWVHNFFMAPVQPDIDAAPPASEDIVKRSFADALGSLLSTAQPEAEVEAEIEPDVKVRSEAELASGEVDTPIAQSSAKPCDDVASIVPSLDRMVPLTRMPLRPQGREITWPRELDVPRVFDNETERLGFLAKAAQSNDPDRSRTLVSAYQQENTSGRILALRGLRTSRGESIEGVFIDALHVGTDEERALAVDALIAWGRTNELTCVLHDRVDAIAAVAALGYVGSRRRDDYVEKLAPHIDRARIENILILLAGIVE